MRLIDFCITKDLLGPGPVTREKKKQKNLSCCGPEEPVGRLRTHGRRNPPRPRIGFQA